MIVPFDQLQPDVLRRVIEDFITREGTDYGAMELDLETKVDQLRERIKNKQVYVSFDEIQESVSLIGAEDAKNLGLLDESS